MTEIKVTVHNKAEIKVLAQIYSGFTLVSSCFVAPGQIRSLLADSLRFDIFFKNGATGWEIARQLDSATETFTLSGTKGSYILTGHKATGAAHFLTDPGGSNSFSTNR